MIGIARKGSDANEARVIAWSLGVSLIITLGAWAAVVAG